jgi:hypothetical protein
VVADVVLVVRIVRAMRVVGCGGGAHHRTPIR